MPLTASSPISPPGKDQRLDDVGVGGERDPRGSEVDYGSVVESFEERVAKLLEEELLDERLRRLPAGAVRERDDLVAELRAAHTVTTERARECA